MFTRLAFVPAAALGLAAALGPGGASAAGGTALLEEKCAACHALEAPAASTLDDRRTRKGPPLYYAADKFRRDWLVQWLQNPERIRPAGDFYGAHIEPGPKGDVIVEASLEAHPALDAATAQQAADQLAQLSTKAELLAAIDYEPKPVSKRLGMLNFGKFKGCASCHSDEPGYGGVSGPELYTAFLRLRPEFIVSYIIDPDAWEPHSLMPNQHLGEDQAEKLANYLLVISEGEK